ncbi:MULTISPECIES: hypothetical protein [unclassified Lysinibacillus]|uniref:hypothetical protein n=1 Tax=unclassified Lysinibacillus TaxID=2636778 RepID=UPI0038118E2D
MKKWVMSLFTVFIATFVLSINEDSVKAAEMDTNENNMAKYYDADNQEITPYTEEEYLKKIEDSSKQEETLISSRSAQYPNHYDDFGKGEFKNFVWINNGKLYKNPVYVTVERVNRTKDLAVYFYDSSDKFVGKVVFPTSGTFWKSAPTDHLPRGKSYKFKLVSESGELAKVKQGEIGYDN